MKTILYAKQKLSIDEILKWDFKKFSFKDIFLHQRLKFAPSRYRTIFVSLNIIFFILFILMWIIQIFQYDRHNANETKIFKFTKRENAEISRD